MALMKCHYEVLGVERDASDDELKRSYKKLALKWHPDKNLENIEEATLTFRSVQVAYEVLSDPQERAWYDKHREAILRGGMGQGDKYNDESLDVYAFFNTQCFSGFNDDNKGFYAVYRVVFENIAEEDAPFNDDRTDIPGFGGSTSSYEEVVHAFYCHWESYSTAKSYVWVDQYDPREAPNRLIRRKIEAENKKLRDTARKERNEEVRALVGYVRKRDRRVQAHKVKLLERAEEVKRLTEAQRLESRKERLRQAENYQEAEWAAHTNLENQLLTLENKLAQEFKDNNELGTDEEEEEEPQLECVACNKVFRTERSLVNHEKSKKHKENVMYLRQALLEEEGLDEADLAIDTSMDISSSASLGQEKSGRSKKQKKRRKQQNKSMAAEVEEEDEKATPGAVEQEPGCSSTTDEIDAAIEISSDLSDVHLNGTSGEAGEKPATSKEPKPQTGVASLCQVCQETFPSRSKLFKHIQEKNHASLKTDPQPTQHVSNKGKKKGKRR